MLNLLIYGMIFCGAALMIYNIYGFTRFALYVRKQKAFDRNAGILYLPIVLLVMFFIGYLAVGHFAYKAERVNKGLDII